ncbi:MAG: cell division protein FtsA [Candidatus Kerfeldbacteria bacterium]|nr:cell division protein FtsA [Candidatus Kerfeldbacteria bacterium]
MAKESFITGLDIGSSTIRVVVGQVQPNTSTIHVVGAAEREAQGISKGSITSIEDAVSAISSALETVERMTGIPTEHAFVGVGGTHIASMESHGVVAVSRPNGEIREDDVERVVEAAQTVATPPNYEILHVIPRTFTVDNQRGIKDPVGMTGMRLEVDAQIIQGLSGQIKSVTKAVFRTGLSIDDLVLGSLAAAEAALSKRQRELGVCLVNIGGATTSVVVFEEGDVLHVKVLPVGAGHITNDIAIGLRTSIELAEQVKLGVGTAAPDSIGKREEINLADFAGGEPTVVSRKHVAEIIEARLEEIFRMADKELQSIGRAGMLPAGIVLTGGGAQLNGLLEVAKKAFRLPASTGLPQGIVTAVDKVNSPAFTTGVGLVAWGAGAQDRGGLLGKISSLPSVNAVTDRMRQWFKNMLR